MDLLRRHISLVLAGAITLCGSIVLGWFLWQARTNLQSSRKRLLEMKVQKERVQKSDLELTPANCDLAKANRQTTARKYIDLLHEVSARYPSAESEEMEAIACKDRIKFACDALCDRLHEVKFTPDVSKMTLSRVLDSDLLPKAEDVPLLIKQLNVVDELVNVVKASGVSELAAFTRNDPGLQLQKGPSGEYNFSEYGLTVVGDFNTVRSFLNLLSDARFLFIVRYVELNAQDVAKNIGSGRAAPAPTPAPTPPGGRGGALGPAGGAPTPAGAAARREKEKREEHREAANPATDQWQFKENRLVFKDLCEIKAVLVVDYVEFIEDKNAKKYAGVADAPVPSPKAADAGKTPDRPAGKPSAGAEKRGAAKPVPAPAPGTKTPDAAKDSTPATGQPATNPAAPSAPKDGVQPDPEHPREEAK